MRGQNHLCRVAGILALGLMLALGGCAAPATRLDLLEATVPPGSGIPRELDKASLPAYRVEPPDILLVDAVKVVPKAPYELEPFDVVQIVVTGTLPDQPIAGLYALSESGVVSLGPAYGSIQLAGQSIDEAKATLETFLGNVLVAAEVSMTLAEPAARQQIAGEHLIGPDGTVNLGVYGNVYVANLTVAEVRQAIEAHLSEFLEEPKVSVDVYSFNSKVYYVIGQGAGQGDTVARFPITGNETVLDAVSLLGGLGTVSSKRMWISRPAPDGLTCDQVLPINWREITQGASPRTNYQLMPGDRLFIAEDKLVLADTLVGKITAPVERLFGFTLLGAQTIQIVNRFPSGGGVGGNNNFF